MGAKVQRHQEAGSSGGGTDLYLCHIDDQAPKMQDKRTHRSETSCVLRYHNWVHQEDLQGGYDRPAVKGRLLLCDAVAADRRRRCSHLF